MINISSVIVIHNTFCPIKFKMMSKLTSTKYNKRPFKMQTVKWNLRKNNCKQSGDN